MGGNYFLLNKNKPSNSPCHDGCDVRIKCVNPLVCFSLACKYLCGDCVLVFVYRR